MPSTPESLLRTELQATGENATTWGIKTNNNIELLAEAIAGVANVNVGGSGNYTLVATNYVSDEARPATLVLTGTLTGNRDVIVPTSPKQYVVRNQTSGAFTLTIRQSAGTGVVVPQGTSQIVCTSTTCVDAIGATAFAKTLLDDSDAAAARLTLGIAQIPTGSLMPYAGAAAPSGWLLCAGQAVSRTTYSDLFAALSTTYGPGDGSTTFNLPDLRGRAIFGRDDMGGTAANRVTNAVSGITGTLLGAVGGSQLSGGTAITQAQMPVHGHTGTTDAAGAHNHPIDMVVGTGGATSAIMVAGPSANEAPTSRATTQSAGTHTHTFTTNTNGGGAAHDHVAMPPTVILNYIIKT